MFINHIKTIFIIALIAIMICVAVPVSAAGPVPSDITVVYHALTGMARFMGAPSGRNIFDAAVLDANATFEDAALAFLEARGGEFGITNPRENLRVLRETQTENGTNTVRYQQLYHGIPVLAGELIVHMDSGKNVLTASGEILPGIDLDVTPVIDGVSAAEIALQSVSKDTGLSMEGLQASIPELWIYNPALLAGYPGPTSLVWRIEVTPSEGIAPIRQLVLVEAARGGIPLSFNQVDSAKNRLTYNANTGTSLPGTLVCNESNPTCSGGTADAINAHKYAGHTYDFYMANHGRDSINGAGMALISTVNYGVNYQNAFWSGTQMVYGAGFSSADDVVAHELTHGVTEYESGLFYYYQSGAINESFSDVWGEFVDLGNAAGNDTAGVRWQMGEDLPASIGVIRNMSDPTIYGDPDKMTSGYYYTGSADSGGVHTNSGVNNKAAYLMVDGATFNGKTVTGMGITKVAKIYYYAQANLLTSGADYADLYYALQTSCSAQVGTAGITTADCQEVLDAIDAVQMNLQPVAGFNTDTAACDVAARYPANWFSDNLENGVSKWLSGAISGTNRWVYGSPYGEFAHSGHNFLYADDYPGAVSDSYVRMATSVTVPPSGKLLFQHAYHFETTYDGGVLEYSTNGGSSWTDAGSLMDGNGYDGTLSSANPLGTRQAFMSASHGYISTRLNLSSLAGQSVMFRWRMGLDSSGYVWGWWLDDVQVYECVRFSDVPSNYWAYSWIDTLAANNITGGCAVGAYCPVNNVTRAEMAVFLERGMHGSSFVPPNVAPTFTDTVGHWAEDWIEALKADGITGGCGVGLYCPNSVTRRSEMAIFLLRSKYGSAYVPPAVGTSTGFSDVPTTHWAAAWIKQLAAEGITSGCGGGNYCPESAVTRDQMAVFLVRTFGLVAP